MRLRVQISTYTQITAFNELKSKWNELLKRSYADSVFMTWEWCSTWWQAYQPGELWIHTIVSEQGNLIGIAPFFIEQQQEERIRAKIYDTRRERLSILKKEIENRNLAHKLFLNNMKGELAHDLKKYSSEIEEKINLYLFEKNE